jgi:ribosomal protein L29
MELRSLSKEELLERLESIRAEKAQRSVEKAAKTRSVTKRKKVGTLLDQLVKQLIEASPEERAKRLAELGLKEVKK